MYELATKRRRYVFYVILYFRLVCYHSLDVARQPLSLPTYKPIHIVALSNEHHVFKNR